MIDIVIIAVLGTIAGADAWAADADFAEMIYGRRRTVEKGHRRIETRTCTTLSDSECLAMLAKHQGWPQLRTVVHIHSKRQIGDAVSEEDLYYLSSLPADTPQLAQRALDAKRSHWGIEKRLHWVLDVTFHEDQSRVRAGNAA